MLPLRAGRWTMNVAVAGAVKSAADPGSGFLRRFGRQ